jgi:hypothetical protein
LFWLTHFRYLDIVIGLPCFQIKKEFVKKSLPQAPPKKILRMRNQTLLEESIVEEVLSGRLDE